MKNVSIKLVSLFFCILIISGCGSLAKRKHHDADAGKQVAQIAARYKGVPYLYGGVTPRGFDCSGFTSFVFQKAGIEIPRTTSGQYRAGKHVSRSELRKGDLVFFTRWRFVGQLFPPSHVGIYMGGDQFIHAPANGGNVRYDSLADPYWRTHYKGARDFTLTR